MKDSRVRVIGQYVCVAVWNSNGEPFLVHRLADADGVEARMSASEALSLAASLINAAREVEPKQ